MTSGSTGSTSDTPDGSEVGAADTMWTVRRADGTVATGWFILPLRLFIGATFLFAGLQKLANPRFFAASSPTGIHAQLIASTRSSPIHALITHLVSVAPLIGAVIAVGEVAVGLGVLVGLWMRAAAGAGMILSLSLFLAVSFHASPYYNGSDIVFFFAWTPLALAGAAGAPALDTWLARRRLRRPDPAPGLPRRDVLTKGALAGLAAGVVIVVGGLASAIGRAAGGTHGAGSSGNQALSASTGSSSTTSDGSGPTTTAANVPSGASVGPASGVPVGGAAAFTDPATGDPALVIQQVADTFVAFDAICPHAGCTVAYQTGSRIIACPCHGSEFNPRTGAVIRGPATYGLTPIKIIKGTNGNLYVPK